MRIVRRAAVVALLALVAGVLPSAAPAAAATALPSDLDLLLTGGGWGHGHGMSQYGARGQAEAGQTWRQILASYYSGVTIADEGSQRIRVLLDSAGSFILGGPEHITAKWSSGATILGNTSTYPFFRVRAVTEGVAVDKGKSASGPWYGVTVGGSNVRFFPDGSIVPWAGSGKLKYFRGFLEANRRSSSTLYLVNQLSLEQYLRGVVPRESPASWHINALRAQAVAARSYTLWKKANASSSTYDICATTACQVYGGYGYRTSFDGAMTVLENSRTNTAISDTGGDVMTVGGDAIFAEYHSTSGGHTSQGSRSYLAPRADPHDADYSPYHRWSDEVKVSQIEARWPSLGRLTGIDDVVRDGDGPWGGRVKSMTLTGTGGSVTVSGDTFRIAFGLRSTLFTIGIYESQTVSAPSEVLLEPGETKSVSVVLKNTGNRSWPVGGDVKLGTWEPKDRDTAFNDSSWNTSTRPTSLDVDLSGDGDNRVSPGEQGRFTFTLAAPATLGSGYYAERFRPLLSGRTMFGHRITIPVRVVFDGASHLGASLAQNGSFESDAGGFPAGWEQTRTASGDLRTGGTAVDDDSSLRIKGDPAVQKAVRQRIAASGDAADRFVLSAWNRASGVDAGGGNIDVTAKIVYTDGTTGDVRLIYPRSDHRWTYREAAIRPTKAYEAIDLYTMSRYQTGTTWFDRVRLAREDLLNNSFEAGSTAPTSWRLVNAPSGSGRTRSVARGGDIGLGLRGSSASSYARQYVTAAGDAGDTLRLSGWNRSSGTSASSGSIRISMRLRYTDGTTGSFAHEFPREPHDWRYGELPVTAAKAYNRVDVFAVLGAQTGATWFDELSLQRSDAARSLSANSGFELGTPAPGEWDLVNTGTAAAVAAAGETRDAVLQIPGAADVHRYARQYIPVAGAAGDAFVLSGWNKTTGSSASGGPVTIWARVNHTDGTKEAFALDFGGDPHDWTRKATTIATAKPYLRIDLFARYENQTGEGSFDSIRLQPA